ncbi:MAG: Ig-like domain-containing protein, partial [Clostridia bacterium]|nr:Ig-like domain-containing protein [Clostridia bacterium]
MIKRSNKKRMAYLFLFAMLVTLFPAGAAFAAVTMDTDKAYYVGNSVYANVYITDSVYANNAVNEIVYATVYSNVYADGMTIALDEDPGDTGNFWGKIGFNTTGNNVTLVDGVYRIPVDATNVNGDIVRIKYGSNEITRPWVPALAATSTTDGATNVSVSDNIYVDFNRDISSTIVNSTYFILEKLVTTYESVSAGVYLDNSKKVRIDPAADLDYSTTYRVTVLSSVYDDVYSGNTLGTNKQWTFTTAAASSGGSGSGAPDTTKPTVSATTPANGATSIAVDTNLTVTFSEAMDANSLAKSEIAFTGGTV